MTYYFRQINKVKRDYYTNKGQLDTIIGIEYYENGEISSEACYYNDRMIRKVIFFYLNGGKNFEQPFDSLGRPNGMFHLWYPNGKLKQDGKYKDGNMVGVWNT